MFHLFIYCREWLIAGVAWYLKGKKDIDGTARVKCNEKPDENLITVDILCDKVL